METRLERGRLSIIQSKGETLEGYPLPSSTDLSKSWPPLLFIQEPGKITFEGGAAFRNNFRQVLKIFRKETSLTEYIERLYGEQ